MFVTSKNYVQDLELAIRELRLKGRPTDCLEDKVRQLRAREPNLKTRMDLHDIFLKEAEKPIYYLYCSRFEIWCIQNYGRVPDHGTSKWRKLEKEYDLEAKF